jgi:CelD/BcsL family acetyltransferase involved in cellulose biosynthesis
MFEPSTEARTKRAAEPFGETSKASRKIEAVQRLGALLPFRARVAKQLDRALLDVAVIDDTQTFKDLEEEWEDLYHNCPSATPFQSWSWLYSWWESFGDCYELRLVAVRDGDLLVGLIPLMLERRWGFRRLLFIGKFDQLDLLARTGWEDEVSEAGVRALKQMMGSRHMLDLQVLGPNAAAWGVFHRWIGPKTQNPMAHYLFMEVKPWDELLASLSRNHRQIVRRTLRRAEEDGVRSVLVGPEEAEQAARKLVALHLELLRGRHIFRGHLTSRFESFIVAAASRMTDRGLGAISEFRRDGEVLISQFAVFGDKVTDAYLIGVSQEGVRRYQWSSLGIRAALDMACGRNSAYVCLSNGREPYKQRQASEEACYHRVVLGRGPVLWCLYLAYLSVREVARRRYW